MANLIKLSHFTKALLNQLKNIKPKPSLEEHEKISVSQTASFFALVYEKIRNAVEYRETHLLRRSTIERILKRRLAINPEGKNEAENLIRELLWARYFPNEGLGIKDVANVQSVIDKYLLIKNIMLENKNEHRKTYLWQFLFDLLTCEVEEALSPQEAKKNALQTFYLFHVLKNKIQIGNMSPEQKNAFFYVAVEKTFAQSDTSYLRFHLFTLSHSPLSNINENDLRQIIANLPEIFSKIDILIKSLYPDKFRRFIQKETPPFKILFELLNGDIEEVEKTIQNKERLWSKVQEICKEKYSQTSDKLKSLAVRAIIYIFLTKMVLALILEYPLSIYLFNDINYIALIINAVFPPILMFIIIGFIKVPGADNTKRLYERLVDIIDADMSFETRVSFAIRENKIKKPTLIFVFTIIYLLTFIITFSVLYRILSLLHFNAVSQVVFVFFISIVSFFGYRIRQIAKEYRLQEKESFFRPFLDFFFIPILSLGKFLSSGIAKLNFFGFVFDFLIEAPFKMIIEVIEEWINFIKARRDEIV